MRAAFRAIGVLSREESQPPLESAGRIVEVFYGRMAARADFLCAIGDRVPGTTGRAVAEQILGFVPAGYVPRPSRRRYPMIAVGFPMTVAMLPARVQRARRDTGAWWRQAVDRVSELTLDEARGLFAHGAERFTHNLCLQATAVAAGVQPVHDQLTRLVERSGLSLPALTGGYGSHAELEMINDLWACSRAELSLEAVLRRHGFHGPGGGEISGSVWREDPEPLITVIETYRRLADEAEPMAAERERANQRRRAEADLLRALPAVNRPWAHLVFKLAHHYLPLRGVAKVAFMQALDVMRAAARRVGDHLADQRMLADPGDVFFLTAAELRSEELPRKTVIDARRADHERFRGLEVPASWQGQPQPKRKATSTVSARVVTGTGVSTGIAEGRARVITDPATADVEPGEILITHTTDPSWAAVLFVAAALVVDIGGPLSHAAVVARELGIPCVVGTEVGTQVMRSGERWRVDGDAGTVELLGAD